MDHTRREFGRELIERRGPYDLQGASAFAIDALGVHCDLEFPLVYRAGVLETGVPDRDAVFELDRVNTQTADLTGLRILLLEDDFLLATGAARALSRRGGDRPVLNRGRRARVPGQASARYGADRCQFGRGTLVPRRPRPPAKAIPFAFLTGYDEVIFPSDVAEVTRLKKPMEMGQILDVLRRLWSHAPQPR